MSDSLYVIISALGLIGVIVILVTILGVVWLVNAMRNPDAAEKMNVIGYVIFGGLEFFAIASVGVLFFLVFRL